ncbi:hypothetical protein WJX74_010075 [Apatococcus lobatus]|uniref:UBC core domain-containing protein n=1 Tax=Apatococcus lobatus TaxID=904363 RepID=A0AAW1SD44_9CHLO
MSQQARCSARLLRDLKEVLQQPLPDVNALPCNDDLLVWHGNVRGQDAVLGESLVHFVLIFPSDYPSKAPGVWLFTPVPHPNIVSYSVASSRVPGANWKLAMWDCIPGRDAWSSAYTVHSILLQLQVFLLDEDLQWDTSKVTREAAIRLAAELVVPACGHGPGHPFPPLPTPEDLAQAASAQGKVMVTRPKLKPRAATSPAPSAARLASQPGAASIPVRVSLKTSMPSGLGHVASVAAVPAPLPRDGKLPSAAIHHAVGASKQAAGGASVASAWSSQTQAQEASASSTGVSCMPVVAAASQPGVKKAAMGPSTMQNADASTASSNVAAAAAADGWVEVKHRGNKRKHSQLPGKAPASWATGPGPSGIVSSSNAFQALQATTMPAAVASAKGKAGIDAAAVALVNPSSAEGASSTSTESTAAGAASTLGVGVPAAKGPKKDIPGAPLILSKAAKKNAARSAKRAQNTVDNSSSLAAASMASSACSTPTAAASSGTAAAPQPAAAAQPAQLVPSDWTTVKGSSSVPKESRAGTQAAGSAKVALQSHAELIQNAYKEHADMTQAARAGALHGQAAAAGDRPLHGVELGTSGSMGPLLDQLSPDTLSGIMCLLGADDLACLGSTCWGLKLAVDDGLVWRSMLQREFPQSQLTASSAAEWKHTYLLQASAVVGDLQCFFTKHPMAEACLGLPLRHSMNPKTQQLDYIEASLDLVSLDAVHSGWVTRSPDGQEIQACLPLYLTYEHFERVKAGRGLQKALCALAPEQIATGGAPPPAATWLQIMPKLLNTAIVLLMDKGVAASERALVTYCSLHRLFLALAEDFNLFTLAADRMDRFLKVPASRVKAQTPNMGWFIPLLTLGTCPDHTWKRMASMIVEEGLDRSIIWICKHNPDLQESLSRDPNSEGPDTELLEQSFAACSVGLRLIAFHVAFLTLIARPGGSSPQQAMEVYDALYGRPGPAQQRKMKQVTQKILAMDSWATYLRMIGLPLAENADAVMTRRLRVAWRNSLHKRYHSKGMDFSRIQASGVSKLLLRGQQYTAPPNMKRIHVLDQWRFAEGGECFLDATMFLLAKGGRIVDTVDFASTRSFGTSRPGAVSHSGDIMHASGGTHTIDVQMAQLGANVVSLVLVLSAYSGSHLNNMLQPFVVMEDPATKMPLCEYHLEKHSKAVLASHKAVVMCRIFLGPTGSWQVEALGHLLPHGSAGNYEPIRAWLKEQSW